MHITELSIQNYQSHKDSIIEFSPGLNVIIGESDKGKSAILRAIRKVIRDDPSGKTFISHWADSLTVKLKLSTGVEVVRNLTSTKNRYYLDAQEFGGFGREIPQEIRTALDMPVIEFENGDTLDLYFTDQHDGPFMLSAGSSGLRSKLLGKIAGLHVLDSGISRINADIRGQSAKTKQVEEDVNLLAHEVDNYAPLWYEFDLIQELEGEFAEVSSMTEMSATLRRFQSTSDEKASEIERIERELRSTVIPDIPVGLEASISLLSRLSTYRDNLRDIISQASVLKQQNYPDLDDTTEAIREKIAAHTLMETLKEKYDILRGSMEKLLHAGKEEDTRHTQQSAEFATLLGEEKNCPLCGNVV